MIGVADFDLHFKLNSVHFYKLWTSDYAFTCTTLCIQIVTNSGMMIEKTIGCIHVVSVFI